MVETFIEFIVLFVIIFITCFIILGRIGARKIRSDALPKTVRHRVHSRQDRADYEDQGEASAEPGNQDGTES